MIDDDSLPDFRPPRARHHLTRFVLLRGMGFIHLVAFSILVRQGQALIGPRGLLPLDLHVAWLREVHGGVWKAFWRVPSLFVLHPSGTLLEVVAWAGLVGSCAVVLGVESAPLMLMLWALSLSVMKVGQVFWGYGWELLLAEAGFLAIFLCPWRGFRPMSPRAPRADVVVWLYRWLAFRVMFGAGLIKIRGDSCWRDLTCMQFHYETQPIPHPLSWWLHHTPAEFHKVEVGFNHLVELVVPFALFLPRPYRTVAGVLLVVFQLVLIASGNLSFLNWLTLVVCLSAFDDPPLLRVVPKRLRGWVERVVARAEANAAPSRSGRVASWGLALVVAALSLNPVINMLSPVQAMNRSFEPFNLVNTYGAFGSVGRVRSEIVIEGTRDAELTQHTVWRAYPWVCKPDDEHEAPCLITPYHRRLDWQAWFAAMQRAERQAWLHHLIFKLLHNDPRALSLLAGNPFPGAPPRYIRVQRYRYRFTKPGEPGWWRREHLGGYIRPLSLDDPGLQTVAAQRGWRDRVSAPRILER